MKKIRSRVVSVLVMVLLVSMMLPKLAFAGEKVFTTWIDEDNKDFVGTLLISNFIEDNPELIEKEINTISIDEEIDNTEYEQEVEIKDAFTVIKSSKIVLKIDKPTMADLKVYKLTKRGEKYTYMYRQALPIASGKIESIYEEMNTYHPGVTIELNEVGEYLVEFSVATEAMFTQAYAIINVVEGSDDVVVKAPIVKKDNITVAPTASKVLVNGVETLFDAYLIEGNNYFKLRDLANVVNGTEKNFEVKWDGEKNAINLLSGTPYTAIGSEMTIGDGIKKTASINNSKLFIDGVEVEIVAYTINDNNYFKLRDIGKVFDIGIKWNNNNQTIEIDTSVVYED